MNRLREVRKAKGLSQQEVADYIGINQNTYSYWERGRSRVDSEAMLKLATLFGVTVDYLVGKEGKEQAPNGVWIPVLGRVQAGIPIGAVQEITDYEEIDDALARRGEYFALRVRGDSMEPRIAEGDVVLVKKQPTAESGDTVIVLINGEDATIKRLKLTPDGVVLLPTNPSYEPLYYTRREVESLPVRILGKVVELRAKF